jgi:preprotein translocase subunit SecB
MVARVVGVFEVEDVTTEEDKQILAVSMVELVYPYLRNVVSSLTFSAFIPPIVLPVRFPEQLIPGFQSGAAFETPEVLN